MSAHQGKILIADDDESFLQSTAALLTHEGFECKTVENAADARNAATSESFDVVIADIYMPGNEDLELARTAPLEGVPVLLVTGNPSLESVMESMRLPVAGYLLKPLRREELLNEIRRVSGVAEVLKSLARSRHRLDSLGRDLEAVSRVQASGGTSSVMTAELFAESTVRHVVDTLTEVTKLSAAVSGQTLPEVDICKALKCSRLQEFVRAVDETIDVLERTKRSFKSKELGNLRNKLVELRRKQTW